MYRFLFCLYVSDLKETLVGRGIVCLGVSIDDFILLSYAGDSIIIYRVIKKNTE